MILGSHRAAADLCSLEPGTHLCALEPDGPQLDRVAATFVAQGLAAGDQLLYVASDEQVDGLLQRLSEHLDARQALRTGQLVTSSFELAYGSTRPEHLETVADGFCLAAQETRKRGFPALRVAARMDGLTDLLGSIHAVTSWERMSTELQRELRVSSVCLYDSDRLEPGDGAAVAREHDGLAPQVDVAPIATFLAVDEPWGVRVRGEVDVSNRDLLHRLVLSRATVSPRLRLDLEGVTFADAGTVARLSSIAAALPQGGHLVLTRVPDVVRRILAATGLCHDRMRLEP
ncbi:MEDS domain-containing protein [Nocardioides sp. zg-1230]|uniref:MEDS domain-containing protein n=1 Tax=Nocardioides sp. zg-1230 TaxID=2736601 RepID=UPI001554D971|nr:MEDS domain-containing protein [Nocardioides sp. zg-1230]NPC42040.1 STAS domain-containing protein [Nocardioides sp. zg-1230]